MVGYFSAKNKLGQRRMSKLVIQSGPPKSLHIDFSCGKSDGSNSAIITMGSETYRGTSIEFRGPARLVFHPDRERNKYTLETNGEVEIEKL